MNDFIIVKDLSLALAIRSELQRLNIVPNYNGVADFQKFSLTELAKIEKLELTNGGIQDISSLKYCSNIKELIIESKNAKKYDTKFSDNAIFNYESNQQKITDFSVINELKSLEYLTIKYDKNLDKLNLKDMPNLSSLTLVGNSNLKEINDISNLKLSEIQIVNNALLEGFDLAKMIDNGLNNIQLDFDLYPQIKKINSNIDEIIYKEINNNGLTCIWEENISDLSVNKLKTSEMQKMNDKVEEIKEKILNSNYQDIEKVMAIYSYIINNVSYDWDSLKAAKNNENNEAMKKAKENINIKVNDFLNRRQSSYNAILEGKSVCEGYTNMMHYFLKSVGIDSSTLGCNIGDNISIIGRNSNHSVIKVLINDNWYYFDPTNDSVKKDFKYFYQTKDEFSKYLTLSITEQDVKSPLKKDYSNDDLIKILNKIKLDEELGINILENNFEKKLSKGVNMSEEQYLSNAYKELEMLQQEYGLYAKQIEDLMKINDKDERLKELLKRKDEVEKRITFANKKIQVTLDKIKEKDKRKHQGFIYQIEQLLGEEITPLKGFEVNNNGIPKQVFKDYDTLVNEYKTYLERLKNERDKGSIDFNTYRIMHNELQKEYESMYKNAPRIKKDDNNVKNKSTENEFEEQFRKKFDLPNDQKDSKKELEEQKRELRRKKFYEKVRELGLDNDNMDLEKLFMEQETIRQHIEQAEQSHQNLL